MKVRFIYSQQIGKPNLNLFKDIWISNQHFIARFKVILYLIAQKTKIATTNGIKILWNSKEIYYVYQRLGLPKPTDVNWQEMEIRDEFVN